jgi:hypothetical protein
VLAALGAAGFFGYLTTLDSPGGDLARVVGMRLIALFNVIEEVDEEVGALDKATVVGRLCFSKVSVRKCKLSYPLSYVVM